jgi:hypothetical protein
MKSAPVGTFLGSKRLSTIPRRIRLIFGPKFKLIPKNPIFYVGAEMGAHSLDNPEPEQFLTDSPCMCADITRNSGGIAVLMVQTT